MYTKFTIQKTIICFSLIAFFAFQGISQYKPGHQFKCVIGNIYTDDGSNFVHTCSGDGVPDVIKFEIKVLPPPMKVRYVVTDTKYRIVALPDGDSYDFEGASEGICLVFGIGSLYDLDLKIGDNVIGIKNNAVGCTKVTSNYIRIFRKEVHGGEISTDDPTLICAGDGTPDPVDADLNGNYGEFYAWVITDDAGQILALPDALPFDFEGAGGGICNIYNLSYYEGLAGLEVGNNISDLAGCFDFSNAIEVTRMGVAGGEISTEDPTEICAGDGSPDLVDVSLMGEDGDHTAWVVTDEDGNILSLPESVPIDFEGGGEGVCLIWNIGYSEGLVGLEVGENVADLDGCFDFSNSIMVIRHGVNGGEISTDDPTEICAGDGTPDPIDVGLTGNLGDNSAWVITDDSGNILALPASGPFDLEGAGEGVCLIWNLSYEDGLTGLEVGNNTADLDGCYDFSNSITVTRHGVDGGVISTEDPTEICAGDGTSDIVNVAIEGAVGDHMDWVVTDVDGNILSIRDTVPIDFEGAGEGVCVIWNISHAEGLVGLEAGNNLADLDGCYDLSNSITVTRHGVNGGEISTDDATTICAGDGVPDPIDVNLSGNSGDNSAWVITDDAGTILMLPDSGPFDLEGAGLGLCQIWHLSYADGLTGLEVDNNISDLTGCYDFSNSIEVFREVQESSTVNTAADTTEIEFCTVDEVADTVVVTHEGGSNSNYIYIVTGENDTILNITDDPSIAFPDSTTGVCMIWGLAYTGNLTAENGDVISEVDLSDRCFMLSDNFITVTKIDSSETCGSNFIPGENEFRSSRYQVNSLPSGYITINVPDSKELLNYSVFDMAGQLVMKKSNINLNGGYYEKINVNHLIPGIYIVHLNQLSYVETKKVFVY